MSSFLERILRWWRGATTLTLERNDGFVDLALPVVASGTSETGEEWFHARALWNGKEAGFLIQLSCAWEPWELEEHGLTLWRGLVTYKSAGVESDRFVKTLAREYKVQPRSYMAEAVTFTGIALEGNPGEALSVGTKIKLFFESEVDEEYAEFYTNIYPQNALVEFHEKDPEYRAAVVRALAEGSRT